MSKTDYQVRIADRGEGIEYKDAAGTYSFNAALSSNNWTVYLPGDLNSKPHEFSKEETERVLPRIAGYLENTRWFGLFGCRYTVTFEKEVPFDREAYLAEQEALGCKLIRNADGSTTIIPPEPRGFLRKLVAWIFA